MASVSLVACPRRSNRLAVKTLLSALDASARFYAAAQDLWTLGLKLSPDVLRLLCIAEDAEARCTPAAKRIIDAFIYDQPLPGRLEALRDAGELPALADLLIEVEAELSAIEPPSPEEVEREDNRHFREQLQHVLGLNLI
jgi:hypothetical protein